MIDILIASFFLLRLLGNGSNPAINSQQHLAEPALKEVFKKDFLIGTALNSEQIKQANPSESMLIQKHFNAITPENIMKAEIIHPTWSQYDFELADQMVALGKKNNQLINGHTLIWHSQLPDYVKRIQSPDSFRLFFTHHIQTIAKRYHGKIFSWDVVNEALNEDGSLRKSVFLDKLGPAYLVDAFKLAEQASPNTELYYNDYNIEQPKKRAGCIDLIKTLQKAGARIDGVGIQGHWQVGKVPLKDIEESIVAYAQLGMKVMITELDIEMLPRNVNGADVQQRMKNDAGSNPYKDQLPDSMQQKLAKDYESLFKLFLKHQDKITRITFWGVHDQQSWLNGWPIPGRTNYPLLFDRSLQPKPAFYSVINLKRTTK